MGRLFPTLPLLLFTLLPTVSFAHTTNYNVTSAEECLANCPVAHTCETINWSRSDQISCIVRDTPGYYENLPQGGGGGASCQEVITQAGADAPVSQEEMFQLCNGFSECASYGPCASYRQPVQLNSGLQLQSGETINPYGDPFAPSGIDAGDSDTRRQVQGSGVTQNGTTVGQQGSFEREIIGKFKKTKNSAGYKDVNIGTAIGTAIKMVLGMLGVIFLVLVVYGGFLWLTSNGDEKKIGEAMKLLSSSIIGLLITLAAYGITVFVINALNAI